MNITRMENVDMLQTCKKIAIKDPGIPGQQGELLAL